VKKWQVPFALTVRVVLRKWEDMMKLREGELNLGAEPLVALQVWLNEAVQAGLPEPTAMNLATVDAEGQPSSRIVLLKGIGSGGGGPGEAGLEFYTNYESRKSQHLLNEPRAALCFHWVAMRRQVRVEGVVQKLTPEENETYFQTRPRESRLGAWSSPQSREVASREDLLAKVKEIEAKFGATGPVPCPPFWGGWRLRPHRVEFWEERPHRLHERVLFVRQGGGWVSSRLAP